VRPSRCLAGCANRPARRGKDKSTRTFPTPFVHANPASGKAIFGFVRALCKGNGMTINVYRRPDVERITGLSRSTLYAMMAEGNFPKPIKLGKRAVGWREADIAAWLDGRPQDAA